MGAWLSVSRRSVKTLLIQISETILKASSLLFKFDDLQANGLYPTVYRAQLHSRHFIVRKSLIFDADGFSMHGLKSV